MKPLIALTLALLALTSHAAAESTMQETCKSIAGLAGAFMKARQNGQDMSVVMEIVGKHFEDAEARKPYERMVILAYESPRFSSEEYKNKAVSDFKNTVYLGCFKAKAGD